MYNRKTGRSCSSYRPLNDVINQPFLPFYEQNTIMHNCSDCVYFSSKNCGNELSDVLEAYDNFY